jgi:hypothetical protein
MDKLDYKKEYRDLYLPRTEPMKILVPKMTFIITDGRGDPNEPDGAYAKAVGMLYALSYTIKMGKDKPGGYFDYVVPPLEGLWWYDDGGPFRFGGKSHFCWTMMIRQPEFVTREVFEEACRETGRKKPGIDTSGARLCEFEEGLCVQCMHLGPYDDEPRTVEKMETYMRALSLAADFTDTRRHHEIYLTDPRKGAPSGQKTVIRHPVRQAQENTV